MAHYLPPFGSYHASKLDMTNETVPGDGDNPWLEGGSGRSISRKKADKAPLPWSSHLKTDEEHYLDSLGEDNHNLEVILRVSS